MAYEIEYNGQIYEVDDSGLDQYVNPETGELQVDVLKKDLSNELPGMDESTQAAFNQANQDVKELGMVLGVRGNNEAGALRNLAMGTIPGTAEAEAALRASAQKIKDIDPTRRKPSSGESWSDAYNKYLQNAYESRTGYAQANPARATALQLLGGIGGALVPFGAVSKIGALGKLGTMGRGAIAGGTSGAAFGFGNTRGDFDTRLNAALKGLGAGAVAGGVVAPLASYTIGGVGNTLSRIKGGYGKGLPQQQVEGFMLSNTLAPTTKSRRMASMLGLGAARGAQDIEDAAYDLYKLRNTMNTKVKPASYGGATAGGTTAKDFLKATQTESLTNAKKKFGEFVESTPTIENPTRPAQALFENNETALKILNDNADNFLVQGENGVLKTLDPGSFEYWQKVQQTLSNKLPKKYNPSKLTGAKKYVYDALEKVRETRDKLFPGTKRINAEYSDAIADQTFADQQLNERLRVMSSQEIPQDTPSSIGRLTEVMFGGARRRGIARELIKEGGKRAVASPALQLGVGSTTDSLLRAISNLK